MTVTFCGHRDFYGNETAHTDQVVNLSVQLFKHLRVLHKFPRQYLRILKVAAYLNEAGKKVAFYNYEKHSGYIILNSNINGITHRELVLASFVASYTSIEDINPFDWAKFKVLVTDEDADAVRKMGLMLRLALAFDRGLASVITGINCDILGDSVIVQTEVNGDATLEINSALQLSGDFRKIFKKNLEIL